MLTYARFANRMPGIILGVAVSIILAFVIWNDLSQKKSQVPQGSDLVRNF
jgi:hypothetical protein